MVALGGPPVCRGRLHPDFYCPAAKLVIELDGSQHHLPDSIEYDRARTLYLEARDYHVIRFRNAEVMNDTASVLDRIESEVRRLAPSPNPLPPEEEGLISQAD